MIKRKNTLTEGRRVAKPTIKPEASKLVPVIEDEIQKMRGGHLDLNHIDITGQTDLTFVFNNCKGKEKIVSLDVSKWDVSKLRACQNVFTGLKNVVEINVTGWVLPKNHDSIAQMFAHCEKLERIIGLEDWDVSHIKYFSGVFYECKSLKVAPISKWRPKDLRETKMMFSYCHSLVEPNIENWDFKGVEDMKYMFEECTSLETLDCTKMSDLGIYCHELGAMFKDCKNLRSLPGIENWEVHPVKWMDFMFQGCEKLECDISNWDIRQKCETEKMLEGAPNIVCSWATGYEGRKENKNENRSWLNWKKINESVDPEVVQVLDGYVVMLMMMLKGNVKKTPFNADVKGLQKELEDAMGINNTVHSDVLDMDIEYEAFYERGTIGIEFDYENATYQFVLDGKFATSTKLR